jgi:hypothetical protein
MNVMLRATAFASLLAMGTGAFPSPSLRSELAQSPRSLAAMEFVVAFNGERAGCYLEHNYDFVGNDIANKPGKAVECCGLCYTTQNCHAFTWTDQNGGTCWLKTGRGKAVWKPNAVSSIVIFPNYPICSLETDVDYIGNDIGSAPAASAGNCCPACEGFQGCRAFSWSSHNGGTCWFKSAVNRKVKSTNVISAEPFGRATMFPNCGLEQGVDYVGNDIANVPAAKPDDCCNKCQGVGGCRAYTWTNHNGGTCWLKNLKGDTIANSNAVSAEVYANLQAPSCVLESGVDYIGNDVTNAPSNDAYGCCSICMKTSGCGAFSWSNHNGGTCWLKSGKGNTVAKDGVTSSLV